MGLYHIHIDSQTASPEVHEEAKELGFYDHTFAGHPAGYVHFEPAMHSSIKIREKTEFNEKFAELDALMRTDPRLKAYIEGEYVPTDDEIPYKGVTDFELPPMQIVRRRLSSALGETFRETEFHLVMDFENSDQRVITALLDAGLFGALIKKKKKKDKKSAQGSLGLLPVMETQTYKAIVLTAQGSRRIILPLMEEVRAYLAKVGGVVRGSIKEEIAIKHQLYNMKVEELPEVVDRVDHAA